MTNWLRPLLLALGLCPLWGCKVQNESLRAEVLSAVLPDSQCLFSTTNSPYASGYYDPTVDGGQGYALTLLMRNNMRVPDDDPVALGEIANIHGRAHDVKVTSLDACWYPADLIDTYGASSPDGQLLDCSTIPEQSATIPTFANLDEGGSLGLVQLKVLDIAALRGLFGATYSPLQIPITGRYLYADPSVNPQVANGSQQTGVRNAYSFSSEDPSNLSGRSTFWGDKYPARRDVTIMVQVRANMQMQSGERMTSNWFTFPITVCTGCMQDYCGPLVEEVCARGPCSDGTECLSTGLCANSALICSPVVLYSGARPDFYGQTGAAPCMPAQGLATATPLTCTPVGCQATN